MNRRKATMIGIIGALLGIPAVALAVGFLLSSAITGTAAYGDTNASVLPTSAVGTKDGIDCTSAKAEKETVNVDPIVKRVNKTVIAGSCIITITYKNIGTEPISAKSVTIASPMPGWSVNATNGIGEQIAPDASKDVVFRLNAAKDAAAGALSAAVNFESATDLG